MTLYEINSQLSALLDRIVDPETGEITDFAPLDALQLERSKKIENTACYIKNLRVLEDGIAGEVKALQERKKRIANKCRQLSSYLQDNRNGEKFETSRCSISFRRSHPVEVADASAAIEWLAHEGYDDCLRYKAPELSKSGLKELLDSGVEVPGCLVADRLNMTIK